MERRDSLISSKTISPTIASTARAHSTTIPRNTPSARKLSFSPVRAPARRLGTTFSFSALPGRLSGAAASSGSSGLLEDLGSGAVCMLGS